MSIAILLRNQQVPNVFRNLLLNAVQLPDIKEVILTRHLRTAFVS